MKRTRIQILCALCVLASIPAAAGAQDVIRSVYRNNTSVRAVIHDVERESNSFRADFEHRYKAGFQPDWREADDSRKLVQDLDKALEVLERRNQWGEKPKYLRDDVQKVVNRARDLDRRFKDPGDVLASMRSRWHDLRENIDTLAELYDLPDVER